MISVLFLALVHWHGNLKKKTGILIVPSISLNTSLGSKVLKWYSWQCPSKKAKQYMKTGTISPVTLEHQPSKMSMNMFTVLVGKLKNQQL